MAFLSRLLGIKEPQLRSLLLVLVLGALGFGILMWPPGGIARHEGSPPPGTPVQGTPPATALHEDADGARQQELTGLAAYEVRLAQQLEEILSLVQGAGRVEAYVRLAVGPTRVPAMEERTTTRTIEEQDANGGVRSTTDTDNDSRPAMVTGEGGQKAPFVLREEGSHVEGVVVVAEGARHPEVRAALTHAAALAVGVSPNRVLVLPMSATSAVHSAAAAAPEVAGATTGGGR